MNKCSGCDKNFHSVSAFDSHRTGKFGVDRRCMNTGEMAAIGLHLSIYKTWSMGVEANYFQENVRIVKDAPKTGTIEALEKTA